MRVPAAMALLLWVGGLAPGSFAVSAPPGIEPQPSPPQQRRTAVGQRPPLHAVARRQAQQSRQEKPPAAARSEEDGAPPLFNSAGALARFAVHIVEPGPDDVVAGRIRVAAEVDADRPAAVAAVDFFIDGRLMFSDAEAPYELLWRAGRPANHLIEVRAYGPGRQMVSDVLRTGLVDAEASGLKVYSTRVERVELHVRLEGDDAGGPVPEAAAFEVLEDGVPQVVSAVERAAELPLAVGLLIDHSGSMLEQLEHALDAAGEFVSGLLVHPDDKAFVLGFADAPVVFQEFTNDTARLADAIALIDSGHYTALYDAVVAAARRFEGIDGRRAVVLLTDGADEGSKSDLREAIAAAQHADVALYPVAVDLSPRFAYESWVLHQLAERTGGEVFSLSGRGDPKPIYRGIAEDLRAQYRISYTPRRPGGSGEWRELEIRLETPDGRSRHLRYRHGYFAQ